MPDNLSEVVVEGRTLRGNSESTSNSMGHYGDDGSQGSHTECVDRATDTGITGEDKQVTASSSPVVLEAGEDGQEAQGSEETMLDPDVDRALPFKIVGNTVEKGEDVVELVGASNNVGAMAGLPEDVEQSEVTDIIGTEKYASTEGVITVSKVNQLSTVGGTIVAGVEGDYSLANPSLASEVVSDPIGQLAGIGSVVPEAREGIESQEGALSLALDVEQGSPSRSASALAACSERGRLLTDVRTTILRAAEAWKCLGEDVVLLPVSDGKDADQALMKTGIAEPKSSESSGLQDVASTAQLVQEVKSTAVVTPRVLLSDNPHQELGFAEGSQGSLTVRVDNEEFPEVHVLGQEATIVTAGDAIAATVNQGDSMFITSVEAFETVSFTAEVEEKDSEDDAQLVAKEAGDNPSLIVDSSEGKISVQSTQVLNQSNVGVDGGVDGLSGSIVNGNSVCKAAPCDLEIDTAGHSVVEAVFEPRSEPSENEVTVSPGEELVVQQISVTGAVIEVDTLPLNDNIETEDIRMDHSEPKASAPERDGNDAVMEDIIPEEAVMREGEVNDIVMEDVSKEASGGENLEEKLVQLAGGSSSGVQDVTEKQPELVDGPVDYDARIMGIVGSAMKENELVRVKNLVKNLTREVSAKQDEVSRERSTHTSGSPSFSGSIDKKVAERFLGSPSQKMEEPVESSDCLVSCESPESMKLRELILNGLNLLKSVATDIAEGLEMRLRDSVGSPRGGISLDTSDEIKAQQLDESVAQATNTIGGECEAAVGRRPGSSSAVHPVVSCELVEKSVVSGGLSIDEDRSLGRETATDVEPSHKPHQIEVMMEAPKILAQSPERCQVEDRLQPAYQAEYAIDHTEDVRSGSIPAHSDSEPMSSRVQEGLSGWSVCEVFVDGSPALRDEKVKETSYAESIARIGILDSPTIEEIVEVNRPEQRSGGSRHSNDSKVCRGGFKGASGRPDDYPTLNIQKGTCSLDREVPAGRLGTSGEGKFEATSIQDSRMSFDKPHIIFKSEVETPLEDDRVPSIQRVLAIPKQDFLPVAKRTLPVVTNLEAAAKQAMESTYYRSHILEDSKGAACFISSTKSLAEFHGVKRANDAGSAQEKSNGAGLLQTVAFSPASCRGAAQHMYGGGLENWARPGVMRTTFATVAGDVGHNTHVLVESPDGKEVGKIRGLNSTMLVESAENQLIASDEGNVKKKMRAAVEAVGNIPTVAVKKKLQTKRKKVAADLEVKPMGAATQDRVPCDSQKAEDTTIKSPKLPFSENVETSRPVEHVEILDSTGVAPTLPETSAAEQVIVLWAPEADGVDGSPTDLVNGGQSQGLGLRCNCGKPAVLKTVGSKSPNRGKRYYSCEKYKPPFFTRKRNRKRDDDDGSSCRFFQWLDIPKVTMEDKKEIKLQKRRQLEQILAVKPVTTSYTTRSSSKPELSDHDGHRNQGFLEGVPPVSSLSVEEPKHEDSEEPEPSSKKQKLSKVDPSLSTADSVAFSTRASAARKRKGPCITETNDRNTPGHSSCGDESSHEVSVGDCNHTLSRKGAKRFKPEGDTPGHTYTRRGESSRPPRQSFYTPRAKNIGRMERATADTHHVRKLLPVALAYEKSREVILEESSEDEDSGDHKEDSNEDQNAPEVCTSEDEPVETPAFTSAEREQTPVRPRSQRTSSTPRGGQNGRIFKVIETVEKLKRNVQKVRRDASGSETSLSGDLHNGKQQAPLWIDVPLTSPFEDKDSNKSGLSGQQVIHGVGQFGPFSGNHDLVVNFPTASQSGEKTTISSNTLLLVKEKAREAVNLRRGKTLTCETDSQRAAWTKPADQMKKRSAAHRDVSDSDEEETGPSGSRGIRSLKDMLKRENSDGTTAVYEVADETQPPYCECKTVKRRAALKTVLSNSANQGLRYWVCVNHRPLFQKKSLWEGDPNDESCKFFRWLDTPIISYAERKKQMAARRRRNERRRR
ncbi:hypothetical protein MPTK2_4g23670 [Marchantia polymorpha subsp. ruderalis]